MRAQSKTLTSEAAGLRSGSQASSRSEDPYVRLNFDSLHDFISPVNQLCSITDLILKKYRGKLDGEAETLFGFVQTSANRLQNLVAGLRTYTAIVNTNGPYRLCQ